MAYDFPNAPTQGDITADGQWIYDGARWIPVGSATNPPFVKIAGDTMTGDLTAPNLTATELVYDRDGIVRSNPNLIINGGFDVWQRGSTFTGSGYTADHWRGDGNTGTVNRQNFNQQGFKYCLEMIPAVGSQPGIGTPIELEVTGSQSPIEQGKKYTISFWFRTSGATGAVNIFGGYADDASGTNSVIDFNQNIGSTAAADTWEYFTYTFTSTAIPVGTSKCYRLVFFTDVDVSFRIAAVKFEQGSVATPWFYEDIGTTLAKCQRYYRRVPYGCVGLVGFSTVGVIGITMEKLNFRGEAADWTIENTGNMVIYYNTNGSTQLNVTADGAFSFSSNRETIRINQAASAFTANSNGLTGTVILDAFLSAEL